MRRCPREREREKKKKNKKKKKSPSDQSIDSAAEDSTNSVIGPRGVSDPSLWRNSPPDTSTAFLNEQLVREEGDCRLNDSSNEEKDGKGEDIKESERKKEEEEERRRNGCFVDDAVNTETEKKKKFSSGVDLPGFFLLKVFIYLLGFGSIVT